MIDDVLVITVAVVKLLPDLPLKSLYILKITFWIKLRPRYPRIIDEKWGGAVIRINIFGNGAFRYSCLVEVGGRDLYDFA